MSALAEFVAQHRRYFAAGSWSNPVVLSPTRPEPQRSAQPVAPLLYTKRQAAQALNMSIDSLERYVMGEVRAIRKGGLVLIPRAELERWIERNAASALGSDRD